MDICQKCEKKISWDDDVCPHCGNRPAHAGDKFPKSVILFTATASLAGGIATGIALVIARYTGAFREGFIGRGIVESGEIDFAIAAIALTVIGIAQFFGLLRRK